ncbi:hypothetical protein ACJX0J_037749, partial [Zea mays]
MKNIVAMNNLSIIIMHIPAVLIFYNNNNNCCCCIYDYISESKYCLDVTNVMYFQNFENSTISHQCSGKIQRRSPPFTLVSTHHVLGCGFPYTTLKQSNKLM